MIPAERKARIAGRVLRLAMGLGMAGVAVRYLVGARSSMLLLQTLGFVAALTVFFCLTHLAISKFFSGINAWLGAALAVTPVALVYVFSDAPGQLGAVLFVGISLTLAAIRADGGCEVMTIPAMIFGRRTHLVCIAFSPIDWLETKLVRHFRRSEGARSEARG